MGLDFGMQSLFRRNEEEEVGSLKIVSPTDERVHQITCTDYETFTTIIITPTIVPADVDTQPIFATLKGEFKNTAYSLHVKFGGDLGGSGYVVRYEYDTYVPFTINLAINASFLPRSYYTFLIQAYTNQVVSGRGYIKNLSITFTYLDNTTTTYSDEKWSNWT